MTKKDWRTEHYEKELAKVKSTAMAEKQKRQARRTGIKAKIVGNVKYRKYSLLKKGLRKAGRGAITAGKKTAKAARESQARTAETKRKAKTKTKKTKRKAQGKSVWDMDIDEFMGY